MPYSAVLLQSTNIATCFCFGMAEAGVTLEVDPSGAVAGSKLMALVQVGCEKEEEKKKIKRKEKKSYAPSQSTGCAQP